MNNKRTQGKILKRVLRSVKPYWFYLASSLIFALITVVLTLRIPVLTGQAVDCVIGPKEILWDDLVRILQEMVVTIVLTGLAQLLMNRANNKITYGITRELRNEAFTTMQAIPLSEIDGHAHGDYMSRIVADADALADGLLMGFNQAFTGILTILGTIVFMIRISFPIALVVIVLTPLSLFVARFIATRTYNFFAEQAKIRGQQTSFVEEMIENESIVKLFDYQDDAIEKFDQINDRMSEAALKATFFSSLTNPSTRLINNLIYASVGVFGALSAINGGITVGGLTSFLSYASTYTKPFNEISGVITELQNAIVCAGRLFEMIDMETEEDEPKEVLINPKGRIQFDHVYFSYEKDKPLIEDLNLVVEPGQKVAIVGPTGGGKSTLINLLMRFYEIDAGTISVDNIDIRNISRRNLRENFGMVLQETWLKEGTVKENINFGSGQTTDQAVIDAAKATHAHGFIKKLKDGYNTILSDDGSLSQGQKQLLCISRVMLNIPPMLILDEATSSIDTRTEQKIQSAFNKMMEGRTSFVVAHRLSTIKEADVILFVKDGKVVEQGNHRSLLQKNGFYAKLYHSQFEEIDL